jgi:hypothetical protein
MVTDDERCPRVRSVGGCECGLLGDLGQNVFCSQQTSLAGHVHERSSACESQVVSDTIAPRDRDISPRLGQANAFSVQVSASWTILLMCMTTVYDGAI